LRWCNTYANSNGFAIGDTDTDGDANSDGFAIGDSDGDAHTDANGYADRFAIGDAYVSAWGHTWAVGYRFTRTDCSISCWWNDRWNLLLRLRWPNLYGRLP
jgi:hypothetical protein